MHEHLQRQRACVGGPEFLQLAQGKFPGQNRPFNAKLAGELHALGRGEGHLRGGVDGQLRGDDPGQPHQADILHDERVHAGRVELPEVIGRGVEFRGEHQGVERHVGFDAVPMTERHHLGQFLLGEVVGPQARVEPREPEINRVRAVGHGRPDAIPVTRRGEQFGLSLPGLGKSRGIHGGCNRRGM